MNRIVRTYKRFALTSFLIFCVVWNFVFGASFFGGTDDARGVAFAATQNGNWNVGTTWGGACAAACVEGTDYPGSADTATIVNAAANITVTVPAGVTANFNSLSIGGDATYTAQLTLVGNFSEVGSGSITVGQNGILQQENTATQTVGGSITVQSGGLLTHTDNATTQSYVLSLNANNITIQAGGLVSSTGRGYDGGTWANDGYGPGPGQNTGLSNQKGSGGGHGGRGGDDGNGDIGGAAYCTANNPNTLGSGGGGGGSAVGGSGGGLLRLHATSTITIAGSVIANGTDGGEDTSYDAGGGAGGGISLIASTIDISSATIRANGGNAGTDFESGGAGGGGCVYVEYASSYTTTGATTSTAAGTGYVGVGATVAEAGTWMVVASNNAPTTTDFINPAAARDGSGLVTVTSTLTDANGDTVTLYIDHSVNGGATWASSSIRTVTGDGVFTTSTGKIETIGSTADGNALTFTWDSRADSVTTSTEARLRISVGDGSVTSTIVSSTTFTVDNAAPTNPGDLIIEDFAGVTTTAMTLSLSATSSDDNFFEYKLFYKIAESDADVNVTESDTAITSSTHAYYASSTWQGLTTTTVTGLATSTSYIFKLWAYDSYGNSSSSTVAFEATMPEIPPAPTSTATTVSGANGMAISINTSTNPATTTYAIYNNTTDRFVAADGSATTTAVFQRASVWSGIVAYPLTANTGYQFALIAQNPTLFNAPTSSLGVVAYTFASTPSGVAATVGGTSSVTVSWSGNGTAYYVANATAGTNSGWTAQTSYAFTGLTCGTTYSFNVKARNAASVETGSVSVSATTSGCSSPAPVSTVTPPVQTSPSQEPTVTVPATEEPQTAEPVTETKEPEKPQAPEEQKEPAKIEQKQEQKTEIKTTDPVESKPTEPNQPQTPDAPSEPAASQIESVADVGVKVVQEGQVLKVTNNPSVDLVLDTMYPKVTIQDASGAILENIPVTASIPWTLSEGDGQKCITATFYDKNGNVAKQKVTCVGLDTTPPVAPKVSTIETKAVSIEQTVQGRRVTVRGVTEPFATVLLQIRKTGSLSAFLATPAYAASEGFFVTKADAEGRWTFTFPDVFDLGNYEVQARAKDEAGNESQAVASAFTISREGFDKAVEVIQAVIDNPEVERINETYVAPAVVGIGVANVAVGTQLPQIFVYLRYLFTQPIILLRRRKYKTWGTVYDAFTKQPIDLATVRLVHHEKGTVVRSQVTDTQGRYFLFADPGTYRIEIDKGGYSGFSEHLHQKQEDGMYLRLYHGDVMHVGEDHTEINYSIPLDPIGEQKPAEKLIRERVLKTVQHAISLAGVVITALSFIISPNATIALFFFIHLLMYAISYKFTHVKLPESFGTVTVKQVQKGIHNVVIRVFDSAYNKLIATTLTDRKGRYAALVGPSTYYVVYEKPGFVAKKSPILDYSSQKTNGLGGMIVRDEQLEEQGDTPTAGAADTPSPSTQTTGEMSTAQKFEVMPQMPNQSASAKPAAIASSVGTLPASHVQPDAPVKKGDELSPEDLIAQWKETH